MADLLSSGALLATVLSLFYTLWYPEIKQALDTLKPKSKVVDSEKDIEALGGIIGRRVLPLLVASATVVIALTPDALRVLLRSWSVFRSGRWEYDAVSALYLLMLAMMMALVIHVAGLYAGCRELRRRLKHE